MAPSNNYLTPPALLNGGTPFFGPSGAGTYGSGDLSNPSHKGLKLVIDVTAISGTGPSLTVTILGKDPVSGKTWTILASAALAATGTTVLTVYPGLPATANVSANDVLPPVFQIQAVVAGTTPSVTATVAAHFIY